MNGADGARRRGHRLDERHVFRRVRLEHSLVRCAECDRRARERRPIVHLRKRRNPGNGSHARRRPGGAARQDQVCGESGGPNHRAGLSAAGAHLFPKTATNYLVRVAFLGLPLAAVLLAADGIEIAHAVLARRGYPGERRLRRLVGDDRIVSSPRLDAGAIASIVALQVDLVVSWYFTRRIPMEVVRSAKLGAFGVHPSLLPRHRGPDPTTWAILEGDTETGVTAHRLDDDYDTGAILGTERLAIDPRWSSFDLARALDRPSLRVLRSVASRFARGDILEETPQPPDGATLAPFPGESFLPIRWARPTEEILRHIRALAPVPGASTEVGGQLVIVLRAERADPPSVLEAPGESTIVSGCPVIRTLDGAVAITEAEVDGAPSSARDLARLFGG